MNKYHKVVFFEGILCKTSKIVKPGVGICLCRPARQISAQVIHCLIIKLNIFFPTADTIRYLIWEIGLLQAEMYNLVEKTLKTDIFNVGSKVVRESWRAMRPTTTISMIGNNFYLQGTLNLCVIDIWSKLVPFDR